MLLLLLATGCRKEKLYEEGDVQLRFSVDTLSFDTVFTSVGSATQWLKVYNPSNNRINIQRIEIAGGSQSRYVMNVDGVPGPVVEDVEIAGKDSLFIFVRVNIDPNQQNTPLIVEDVVRFNTNGNQQQVQLVAWGQDAYFYRKAVLQGDWIWENDKPHVIYDWIIVDSASSLTIKEGTQVYLHAYSVLAVNVAGTLIVSGSIDEPVHFQGDRLEAAYQDVPGQWGRIWLSPGSVNNVIDYAIIENGQVGIQADTMGNSPNPTLLLRNSIIRNMSVAGLLLQGSKAEVSNSLITDCGEFAVLLNIGGEYDFRHCTIGNYYNFGVRQTPSLVLNNYYLFEGDTIARDLGDVYFGNCIIWGRNQEEMLFDRTPRAAFNYVFDHCLFRTEMPANDPASFLNCMKNQDPLFVDPNEGDFRLSLASPAIDAGSSAIASGIPVDLFGNSRLPDPDLGAIEYQEED
jgi:hypothetical protein